MALHNICLFPGTFDPITLGHLDIVKRALPLFSKIYIGIGLNSAKKPMFSSKQRKAWIDEIFKDEKKIECIIYNGLTVNLCEKINAKFILRGIRFVADFEYEKTIADTMRILNPNVDTIILTCEPKYSPIASSIVRDIIFHNGNVSAFVHPIILDTLKKL